MIKYQGKKQLYEFLVSHGYEVPKMKEMEYTFYHGREWLKFYDYNDLLKQMQAYLKRSNNIPISTLKSRDGKRKWLTPKEKRAELLLLDYNIME